MESHPESAPFHPPARVVEVRSAPARWPQMMKRRTAAEYLDMSEAALEREVIAGRLPTPVILGGRDHWHKEAIDSALRYLVGGLEVEPEYLREHRERYGKGK